MGRIRSWLTDRIAHFLTKPVGRYELHTPNDLEALKRHIRKGDVLLSEGDQRVSAIIRYLTQSCWSHTALYIGDEALRRGGELAEAVRAEFGAGAEHLLVEALPEGVVLKPIDTYEFFNIRVCRPHRIRPEDLKNVVEGAFTALGWRYDLDNLIDLARYYLPAQVVPSRVRPSRTRLGAGMSDAVICTRLIGELFNGVGYPVLPNVTFDDGNPGLHGRRRPRRWLQWRRDPYPGKYRQRHPSRLAPRDFDVSPYFEIVKFNVIEEGDFDYQLIEWVSDASELTREDSGATD